MDDNSSQIFFANGTLHSIYRSIQSASRDLEHLTPEAQTHLDRAETSMREALDAMMKTLHEKAQEAADE